MKESGSWNLLPKLVLTQGDQNTKLVLTQGDQNTKPDLKKGGKGEGKCTFDRLYGSQLSTCMTVAYEVFRWYRMIQ